MVNHSKTRRSKLKKKNYVKNLKVIGINCNGLSGKRDSLIASISILNPSVFLVQETKFMKKELFKLNNFEIFEAIRPSGGGSLLTGVHSNLNPILVCDGSDEDIEILVVEGEIEGRKIRFINGYGQQESADIDKRIKFFGRLEEEIIKAKLSGAMVCIELDANAKLGHDVIENDPHDKSANGALFQGVIERNNLIVGNATQLCSGLITRTRTTVVGIEKSVIDYLVVCEELFAHMIEMTVDENNKYPIENHRKTGNKIKVTKTDHNMISGTFELKTREVKEPRREIFKYNDEEGLKKFREMTSQDVLTNCFDDKDVTKAANQWLKKLKNILCRSFKKVRIGNKNQNKNEAVDLHKDKLKLQNELVDTENDTKNVDSMKKKHMLMDKIEKIDEQLANRNADKQANIIIEHLNEITGDDGEFSTIKMWNLKKKLYRQNVDVPMAMQDEAGNLITSKQSLLKLYQNTYKTRLAHKPIQDDLKDLQILKEYLFKSRISYSAENIAADWSESEIKKVCSKLKNGKARDRDDLIFELFNPKVCGDDMSRSLQKMFNGIKNNLEVPDFMKKVAITSLYKNKGSKSDFSNQRGIFNVSKVRSILDKILYQDVYETIDQELSYSNIGARKGRNIRDHLFVVYAIINDVINGTSPPIDIQSIDINKCFDEMWYAETHNDLFDVKVQDNKFALIAKLDEEAEVVVKTAAGTTTEFKLEELIMQGSVFGPIKSTIQIDTLGRDCLKYNQGLFKYKNVLSIPPLALIDDCLGFSTCSADAIQLNSILNNKIASKKLRLSSNKCNHLHISKKKSKCYNNLKAGGQNMKKATECSYLGDILSVTGSVEATIEKRRQKGIGISSQISGMINGLSLGHYYFKIAFLFRETMLLNGMLTNLEVWHPVSSSHLEVLDRIDANFLRKILKSHSKTPKEAIYLETGLLPIKYVAIQRRLMYLHHILKRPQYELIRKVYETQKTLPTKNDWYQQISEDRNKLGLSISDEEISTMSKDGFKTLVVKAVRNFALTCLNQNATRNENSKCRNLTKTELVKENYLVDRRFSRSDCELLFALRTRMVAGVKTNFSSQYATNLTCDLCSAHPDSQENLLSCATLRKNINIPDNIEYKDLFRSVEKQLAIVKVYKQLLREREILQSDRCQMKNSHKVVSPGAPTKHGCVAVKMSG